MILFNAGCRSKAMCHGNWSSTGGGLRACARCCNTTGNSSSYVECNVHLCGLENSKHHTCYFCGDDSTQGPVLDVSRCRKTKICADNEVCFVSTIHTGGTIMHQLGCAPKLHCQLHTILVLEGLGIPTGIDVPHLTATSEITFVGRKRGTELCYSCCGDYLCNDADCWRVKDCIVLVREMRINFATTAYFIIRYCFTL
ncbi:hypothetical protein ACJMK2_039473 [Sinanodonta woodiana]|uniref:Uncharacterized protein n=1 Tax=Sinanodonta woodiana TaxID=1069815 RepID=A0ABD3WFI6_SINWO